MKSTAKSPVKSNVKHSVKRSALALALACVLGSTGLLAAGCAPAATASQVTLGFTFEPTNLDISGTAGQAIPQVLLDNVYEGLVRIVDNGAIEPALADRFTISADGLTYVFVLRDAEFHDGQSLTPDDVVWSLTRLLDDESTAILPVQLAQFAKVSTVTADANVVTITLSERDNDLLYNLTQRGGVIFKKDTTNFASAANGTGPYVFASWDKGSSITLERFEKYWGRRGDSQTVIFSYFADTAALSNAMLAGDIDVMTTVQSP